MSEKEMPKEAKRRGGADTLFSAEWFDDDDFAKAAAKGATPAGTPSASAPTHSPAAIVSPSPASTVDDRPRGGPSMALLAIVGIVLFLGGGCFFSVVAAVAAYAFGVF